MRKIFWILLFSLFPLVVEAATVPFPGPVAVNAVCTVTIPSFTARTGDPLSTDETSNTVTPTYSAACAGLLPFAVTISGDASAKFSINGGDFGTTGNINTGQTIQLKLTTSGSYGTQITATPSINGTTKPWNDTTGYQNFLTDANIKGEWSFEQNLNDSTSNGVTMKVNNGSAAYSSSVCVKQGSYSFSANGTTGLINNAGLPATFPGNGSFSALTVVGWVNTSASGSQNIIFPTNPVTIQPWYVYITSANHFEGQLQYATNCATPTGLGSISIIGGTTISTSTNYFFAFIWDGSYINLYLGTDSVTPASDATHVSSGGHTPCTGMNALWMFDFYAGTDYSPFTGKGDQFGVFNRALSLAEITSIWAHGIDGSK